MNNNDITVSSQQSEPSVDNGKLNMFGMQVKISDIIGDKIVDQFMATISPEQMDAISEVLFNEVFQKVVKEEWDDDKHEYVKIDSVKFRTKERAGGYWNSKENDTPIYKRVKATLISKYSELIEEKVVEYINSDEYKAKADQIAKDIIDYAIEGYKKDVIKSIHNRLVLPVTYPSVTDRMMDNNIREIAQEVVTNAINAYDYNHSHTSY